MFGFAHIVEESRIAHRENYEEHDAHETTTKGTTNLIQ